MSIPIILPQWGMGMNEGQVMKWLKSAPPVGMARLPFMFPHHTDWESV